MSFKLARVNQSGGREKTSFPATLSSTAMTLLSKLLSRTFHSICKVDQTGCTDGRKERI
jgi:hypothetical protein